MYGGYLLVYLYDDSHQIKCISVYVLCFLYGSNPVVFITQQTILIQSNTTQCYFNSICYFYMCAACFGLYLAHTEACQYKESFKGRYNKKTQWPLFSRHYFL
jgi:hypothetical protein